jgi:N-dimethylarginine dimethylaminohydrolase
MSIALPANQQQFTVSLLRRNRKVSETVVAQHTQLEERLRKLGVEVRPEYGLSPPLGGPIRQLSNRPPQARAT